MEEFIEDIKETKEDYKCGIFEAIMLNILWKYDRWNWQRKNPDMRTGVATTSVTGKKVSTKKYK